MTARPHPCSPAPMHPCSEDTLAPLHRRGRGGEILFVGSWVGYGSGGRRRGNGAEEVINNRVAPQLDIMVGKKGENW